MLLWRSYLSTEDIEAIVVKAELPGCKADDIDIAVHGNTMTISGEKKQEQEKNIENCTFIIALLPVRSTASAG